jgi:hypothetical protein
MADRFPLIVNDVSQRIEELVAGDNLELTGNGIVVSGDTGAGKYLTSDGSNVFWGSPGNVYLNQKQTLTNKVFESCLISGTLNTITNIPNTALVNPGININGTFVSLGEFATTPNDNTTYEIAAGDGGSINEKVLTLTSSAGVNDSVTFAVGTPASVPVGSNALSLEVTRQGDSIVFAGTVVDNNTVTTVQSGTGGSPVSGAITIAAGNYTTVSQSGGTITITGQDTDTITQLRATAGQTLSSGNFTFLSDGATSVAQGVDGNGDSTITYSSVNTITQIATGNATLSSGNFRFVQSGATTLSQSTDLGTGLTTITIDSVNSDTGALITTSGGIEKSVNDIRLKNNANFGGNTVLKWDSGNNQISNSLIQDNGSTVTIGGDLVVQGTQTILDTTTLLVEDNIIELRKGTSLAASDGGIQINLTTDESDNVTSYRQLQWYNAGGYWRSFDGSVGNRFVTENETQVLLNKTLTSPTLSNPILGNATATTINVAGNATIGGNLTVNGTVTSINSNVIQIDDKEIELASVIPTTFQAVTTNGSSQITQITPTSGLIPGMEVNSATGGISVPDGTTIVSITENTAFLSASVSGNGTATFTSPGATDLTADKGGIRVKGSTDKRIYYDHSRTDKYWVMTENLEIAFGKKFVIGNQLALNSTTLGPTVVNSSLTSVGTLQNLIVDGFVTIGGVITEKVFNSYTTALTPSANVLTINLEGANTILGAPATQAINEWAFTGVGLSNGQSKTLTLILSANNAATYGDACSVDGTAVTNGVQWSGGSPPIATSNTDILTFVIVRDNSGVIKVFGQGNTDFS